MSAGPSPAPAARQSAGRAGKEGFLAHGRNFFRKPLDPVEQAQFSSLISDLPLYGPMIVGLLVCASAVLWSHVPNVWIVTFVVVLALEAGLKTAGWRVFEKGSPAVRRAAYWRSVLVAGSLWGGGVYGVAALVLLLPLPAEVLVPLTGIYVALVALAMWCVPHYLPANYAMAIPMVTPLCIALAVRGDMPSIVLAGGIVLGVCMAFRLSRSMNRRLIMLIVANGENERLRAVAEQAVIDKSRFMAAASHDLRQPLQALGLYQHVLRARSLNEKDARLVDSMERTAGQLVALLDALLDVSSLDSGAIEPHFQRVELQPLFDALDDEFSPQTSDKGLRLHIACEADLEVRTDPLLLGRILRNLLSNAIKFTDQGLVALSCETLIEKGCVSIVVTDEGPGIAASERDRVFKEFYQVDGESDGNKGVGLGLSIVHRLCALLEVAVELDSAPGGGASVSLRLPLIGHAVNTVEQRAVAPEPIA